MRFLAANKKGWTGAKELVRRALDKAWVQEEVDISLIERLSALLFFAHQQQSADSPETKVKLHISKTEATDVRLVLFDSYATEMESIVVTTRLDEHGTPCVDVSEEIPF